MFVPAFTCSSAELRHTSPAAHGVLARTGREPRLVDLGGRRRAGAEVALAALERDVLARTELI